MSKAEDVVERRAQNQRDFVIGLTDDLSVAVAGAKAANLAKMLKAGLPVPAGIVVTTEAFSHHLAGISLDAAGAEVRRQVLSCVFDRHFESQLREALAGFEMRPVAVRSSGVAEDLAGASFAGQYDTFLGVVGLADVEQAIRKCWASAFSDHILQYRKSNRIASARMAVLIQPMVEADAAGVAFTANPVTGNRGETVVSAVRGLGERLVSGQAAPDEWTVRGSEATAQSTPEKAVTPQQVLQIAALARRVEAYFGEPQDIEWAIDGNQLYLLQARPITTLRTEAAEREPMLAVPVEVPAGYWEREASHFPDPLSPATKSTFLPSVNDAFRTLCSETSLLIETLHLEEIGGWVYQRTVPLGGVDRKAPPNWLMPLMIRIVPPLKARIKGSVQAIREDKAGKFIDQWYAEWKPAQIRRRTELLNVDVVALSNEELVAHLTSVRQFLHKCTERHMLLNGSIQLILAEYAFASKELLGWDEGEMMQVFSGLSETSSAPARDLAKIVQFTRNNPEIKRDIDSGLPVSEILQRYPDFDQQFSDYLNEYGCRAIRYELTFPTIKESPDLLFRLIRDQLQRDYDPEADERALSAQREIQTQRAFSRLRAKPEADRARFQHALSRARKAYPVREEHGFYDRDAPLALLRYALLEAGRRMVEQKGLGHVEDVFFLHFDEVLSALTRPDSSHKVVERRKAERNWVIAHRGPESYGPLPPAPPSFQALPAEARFAVNAVFWALEQIFATQLSGQVHRNSDRLKGIAASKGQYTGVVRVIRSEFEFDKIQPGDVLVCPITSPVWSILFPTIGALVTDSGGILSHSAIIAREYRVPAVVATGNATELLQNGQLVTVDGDKGIVLAAHA